MSVNLATALLIVIFVVFVVVLAGQFLYVRWRRRSFRRHTSHPPPNQSPEFPADDAATKELLYFFCLKPHARNDNLSPNKNTDGSSPDDQVVDVFKLLEASGPARFLCTIKEEDKDDVESTSGVDFVKKPATRDVWLASPEEEEVVVTTDDGEDEDMETEFTTPCDSPSFFTPAGSPSRDFMVMKFDVAGNVDDG